MWQLRDRGPGAVSECTPHVPSPPSDQPDALCHAGAGASGRGRGRLPSGRPSAGRRSTIDEIVRMIILGVVEGLTEFLPISSTGHLIVTTKLLGQDSINGVAEIVIQLGAVLAVLWFYRGDLVARVRALRSEDRQLGFWRNLVVAAVPAAILGFALGDLITTYLFSPAVVATAMIGGGIVLWLVERFKPYGDRSISGDLARPSVRAAGAGHRRHPARGARARHLPIGIEHRGRPAGRARPTDRDRLLVLPGHPDPGRGHALLAGQEPRHVAGARRSRGPRHRHPGRLHHCGIRDPLDAGLRGTSRLPRLRRLSHRRRGS